MRGFVRILASFLLPLGISAASAVGQRLDYRLRIDREPAIGVAAEAAVGESLYREESLPELPTAELKGEAVVTADGERWSAGKVLYAVTIDSQRWFCDPLRNRPRWGAGLIVPGPGAPRATEERHLCVRDEDADGAFDGVRAEGYEPPTRFTPVAYELGAREPVAPFTAKTFRRQLVYLGSGGGRLRVGYSEAVGDAGGPASYGELQLELEKRSGGPPEVGFRGVRIQVLDFPGDRARRVRYRVTHGFGGSGEETGRASGGVR